MSNEVNAHGEELSPEVREALSLWLRWNEEYCNLMNLYAAKDKAQLEALCDELDQLRYRVVALTKKLIGAS
jgi:hypothetical protein